MDLQFRGFGGAAERDGCVTYGAISRAAANDPELLALMQQAPPAQRRPNLLFAAVHYLLLRGADHPLAAYYDTVRPEAAPPDADVVPVFRDFCLTYRAQLEPLIATRSTQTNEVGRCAMLLPALCAIAAVESGAALSLLDLGTSAGLNLLFDRYGYTYRPRGGRHHGAAGGSDPLAGPARVHHPQRAGRPAEPRPADHGGPGRPGPVPHRRHLGRRGRLVAGLPVARQPASLQPPAGCPGAVA